MAELGPDRAPCISIPMALQDLLETREELEEVLSAKQRQEEHLRLRERELTALKGALKEEVASHDKELDQLRQQYQHDVDQLRRSMEDVSQAGLSAAQGGRRDGAGAWGQQEPQAGWSLPSFPLALGFVLDFLSSVCLALPCF